MGRSTLPRLVFLLLGVSLAVGCGTSQSATEKATAQAAVLGTWEYEVDGTAPLDRGVFHITTQGDRLRGIVRDQRLGRFRARVDVSSSRLALVLDELRISGHIEDDQFTALLRRPQWDVTQRSQYRRRRARGRSATLYARRIRSGATADKPSILECRSLLREADGCS